jgi:hypothetical protein
MGKKDTFKASWQIMGKKDTFKASWQLESSDCIKKSQNDN